MRSTFSGFNSAVSGLFAAQRALDVVGHNMSNIDTPGFTRQRSNQASSLPTYDGTSGWLGTGVNMKFITQIRDELIDVRYRNKLSQKEYWTETSSSLTNLENIFAEPRGNSITKVLDDFFKAADGVLKAPENNTARATFISTAVTMTNFFNEMSVKFENAISDLDKDANAMVTDLNSMFHQVASLNQEIFISEANGSMANDLRDRRNLLIDKISEYADVEVKKSVLKDSTGEPKETWNLTIDGHPVVIHGRVYEINTMDKEPTELTKVSKEFRKEIDKDGNVIDAPTTDAIGVRVTRFEFYDGQKINMNKVGGKLGAVLQQRDSFGDPIMNHQVKGVPYYIRATNEFMKAFTDEANRIHRSGLDADGVQGEDLFVSYGETIEVGGNRVPAPINAMNVRVNSHIVNSTAKLAIGLVKNTSGNTAQSDTENFQRLYAMREAQLSVNIKIQTDVDKNNGIAPRDVTIGIGKPEDIIKSVVTSTLGVEASEAKGVLANATTEELELRMSRMSVSGVSENEELTNMLKFQHAYNASARMITTVDEMLDVIINRMGRVGL